VSGCTEREVGWRHCLKPNIRSAAQTATGGAPTGDTPLQSQNLRVERKNFTFDLKENPRGRFLRIIEEVNGRYDAIIIPVTGLEQFRDVLTDIIRLNKDNPPHTASGAHE
jgi:hypothetical protein